jgi:hypothetical protein
VGQRGAAPPPAATHFFMKALQAVPASFFSAACALHAGLAFAQRGVGEALLDEAAALPTRRASSRRPACRTP